MDLLILDLYFLTVFLTILQIFYPDVKLIRDQVLINVGVNGPKNH